MLPIQTRTMDLTGTSYEIGHRLGKITAGIPPLKAVHTNGMDGFGSTQVDEAVKLFDRWCPGITEELTGFADALEVKPERIFYYAMTYLLPRCSQIALLPGITDNGKPLLGRNYEFSHKTDDFCLVRTAIEGKYTHMGTSVLCFGRDEGVNEHGLAVSMSSCGFPVGSLPYMRAPKLKGLQFWAVIRALLEQCRDVGEALDYLEGMPVAYNINLILLDKSGHAALYETMDGHAAVMRLSPDSHEQFLFATNHPVLPEIIPHEPKAMIHSAVRYDWIGKQLEGTTGITKDQMKEMLLAGYPDGLCCHYFEEYFGTIKSLVISPADGAVELCWGGRAENGWHTYNIGRPLENGAREIQITPKKADPQLYEFRPIK